VGPKGSGSGMNLAAVLALEGQLRVDAAVGGDGGLWGYAVGNDSVCFRLPFWRRNWESVVEKMRGNWKSKDLWRECLSELKHSFFIF